MQQISEQLIWLLFGVVGMLFTPLVFIALDYWAGIRKAKKRGDRICSNKMKRTVDKVARYYNAILAMMVLDSIQIGAFVFLWKFNEWDCYTFLITPKWQEQGDLASVEIEFETDTVAKKIGRMAVRNNIGDYNIDYNNDYLNS